MKNLSYIFALVMLSGCAATGAPFALEQEVSKNKATIYIYRPEIAVNCCVAPNISINNENIGQLKNGGYLSAIVSPGSITVEAVNKNVGFKSLKLTIDAESGQIYYLRWAAAATHTTLGFLSGEAKKREQEKAAGKLDKVLRVTNGDSTPNGIIQHERELRVMDTNEALPEIGITKKSI